MLVIEELLNKRSGIRKYKEMRIWLGVCDIRHSCITACRRKNYELRWVQPKEMLKLVEIDLWLWLNSSKLELFLFSGHLPGVSCFYCRFGFCLSSIPSFTDSDR